MPNVSTYRSLAAVLMIAAMLMTGCASKYGSQTTKVNYYPDCYQPISDLRKSENTVGKSTATGAVVGALVGATVGYLATGRASGAAIGAAGGAVVGGAVGYGVGKAQQEKDDTTRLAMYSSQLDGDIGKMNRATAAAKVARGCYERHFEVAVSEYKAGNITKEQFKSRYSEITSGMQEAAQILGTTSNESAQMVAEYQKTVDGESNRMGVSKDAVAAKAAAKSGKKAARKAPAQSAEASAKLNSQEGQNLTAFAEKTNTYGKSVDDAKQEEATVQTRLADWRTQANDLMS